MNARHSTTKLHPQPVSPFLSCTGGRGDSFEGQASSSIILHSTYWDGFSLDLELIVQWTPSILCSVTMVMVLWECAAISVFMWVLWIWTQVLLLYSLSHLHRPISFGDKISWTLGWPGTCFVAKNDLELQVLSCASYDYRGVYHHTLPTEPYLRHFPHSSYSMYSGWGFYQ